MLLPKGFRIEQDTAVFKAINQRETTMKNIEKARQKKDKAQQKIEAEKQRKEEKARQREQQRQELLNRHKQSYMKPMAEPAPVGHKPEPVAPDQQVQAPKPPVPMHHNLQ